MRWLGVVAVSVALFLGWLPGEPGSARERDFLGIQQAVLDAVDVLDRR